MPWKRYLETVRMSPDMKHLRPESPSLTHPCDSWILNNHLGSQAPCLQPLIFPLACYNVWILGRDAFSSSKIIQRKLRNWHGRSFIKCSKHNLLSTSIIESVSILKNFMIYFWIQTWGMMTFSFHKYSQKCQMTEKGPGLPLVICIQ